ncbi:MAG: HAMP domain-containing sensor histidine kinase [Pseudomonadota bacterium]
MKDRERRLEIAVGQAEAANAAKSRFLSNISHELKTPLNAIIGFSDVLKTEAFGPLGAEEYKEYVTFIAGGGRRLLELVTEVLEIAQTDDRTRTEVQAPPRPLSVLHLISVAKAKVDTRSPSSKTIAVAPPDEDLWVWAAETEIVHALVNIISNAVKFSPDADEVRVSARRDGVFIRFDVADDGIGMGEADIPLVLSPFDQVDGDRTRKFEGAGTGLPYAKSVVERYGGRLEIASEAGRGATVSIFLPDAGRDGAGAVATQVRQVS